MCLRRMLAGTSSGRRHDGDEDEDEEDEDEDEDEEDEDELIIGRLVTPRYFHRRAPF
ncbi:hypothetical protein K0M31_017163 [Melipona bicolor]|uniref:Uncharacterized protein n=1 Tax=Melipona bicolor TaxID=60889 RepID=A0AA40KS68_9HYME|nr:hypothetical protein K0M31_017163 [Melipona bicolor]